MSIQSKKSAEKQYPYAPVESHSYECTTFNAQKSCLRGEIDSSEEEMLTIKKSICVLIKRSHFHSIRVFVFNCSVKLFIQAAAIYHKGARTILSSITIKAQIEKKPLAFWA
jgi:hypothetical protein